MTERSLPPAGWHPDPTNSENLRYWDGVAWTHHTHPGISPSVQDPKVRHMENSPDPPMLPPAFDPFGQNQSPSDGRGPKLLRNIAIMSAAVVFVVAAGVGIGVFAFNMNKDEPTPTAGSSGTPEAKPSEQTPSPSEDLVNEDAEAAPPSSPEKTGQCPNDAPDELVSGETEDYKVKLCLQEGAASADHVTYVGGNTEKGFSVLSGDMNFDGMGNPYIEASRGGIRYVVDPKGLYVEGDEIIVDQEWVSGNMSDLYDFATG